MLFNTLRQYQEIISSYQVIQFEQVGTSLRLRLQIALIDGSMLHVRETIIEGVKRKYAYHWQNSAGELIIRWDNADHWDVETAPHHMHVNQQTHVVASYERTLEQVLGRIVKELP